MIKDFVPARTSLSTGIIIKPTILERPKYPEPQASWTRPEYTASLEHHSGSDTLYLFSGDNGGIYSGQTSSFTESFSGPSGIFNIGHTDNAEFYNGELSGSVITVTTQSLQNNPLLGVGYRESIGDLQNFTVKASSQIISASDPFLGGGIGIGTIKFDTLTQASSYYNTSTYSYSPKFYNIVDVNISISGSVINSSGTDVLTIYLDQDGTTLAFTQWNIGTEPEFNPKLVVNSLLLQSGSYSVKYIYNGGNTNISSSINVSSSWTISVPNPFAQSTYYNDPTIYTQQNFPGDIGQFDDYYAIYGNVYSNRVSNTFYDVDYSNGISLPTNFTAIMSGSAIYVQVQPSNYTLRRHINPRYKGSKLYGANINQFTTGDSSYATKPVIERYTDYVAQYDYVAQGANSVVHILSLIDIDGNKIALNGNTNFNYGMIKTIFPASSPVSLVDLTINSTTSGSAIISSSIDENNIYVYGGINKIDVGLLVPANFNPYIDVYDVARKAKLI